MNRQTFRAASLLLRMILVVFPGGAKPRGMQISIGATGLESYTTYLVQLVRGIGRCRC